MTFNQFVKPILKILFNFENQCHFQHIYHTLAPRHFSTENYHIKVYNIFI